MQHFLSIADFSAAELWQLLSKAKELKDEFKQKGSNQPLLKGKTLGMVFQKPSLRTRVSFEVGMLHLGGHALYLSPNEIGLGGRESAPDVARVLAGYVDGIMARVFAHEHILQLAEYSRVPVINGLSDFNHPCQALADVFTLWEHFGQVEGLKMAYIGDGNNVAASLITIMAKLGGHFSIATPSGYELSAKVLASAQDLAEETNTMITVTHDPVEAVAEADVVYTDVWTSMGQENERERRLKQFSPFQVNSALVRQAPRDAIVLHCLPAHRGEEITSEVLDSPRCRAFAQAGNRLHVQKALLARMAR